MTKSLIFPLLFSSIAALASGPPSPPEPSERALTDILISPELDAGFHLLYELKPSEARAQFDAWQKSHPEDPLGSASEAASYLFEECYRQGVLTSEFFLDDKRFLGKIPLKPNDAIRAAFFTANQQAQDMARLRLKTNPQDADALFVMALSLGLQADYASLIDKRQLVSLAMIKDADKYAQQLLALAPDAFDAYVTLGAANYIIGSLPAPKRLFLVFKGIHSDKNTGMQQLEIAAAHGHYLRPFAKILLALAALREKRIEVARTQFTELVAEFPENSLFASELAKTNVSLGSSRSEPVPVSVRSLPAGSLRMQFVNIPTPVAYVHVLNESGILSRLNATTGTVSYGSCLDQEAGCYQRLTGFRREWQYPAPPRRGPTMGRIFCLSGEGKTLEVAAGEKFNLLHVNDVADFSMASRPSQVTVWFYGRSPRVSPPENIRTLGAC